MENLGGTVFHAIAGMLALLFIWLVMGNRQIGEFTSFDFLVSITAGAILGAGIADPRIELSRTLVVLIILALVQVVISWLTLKFRKVQRKLSYQPVVLVENGQIIKANLRKAKMTVEMLLGLLRDRGCFDITEVELAILEPHGQVSVLKKAEFQPVTPRHLNLSVPPNRVMVPVILEGDLQESVLARLGLSLQDIDNFRRQHKDKIDGVFVAFMDQDHRLYIMPADVREKNVFLH